MVLRLLKAWLNTPADPVMAEHLSRNKTFQKVILGAVRLPQKISDFLVPDSEIEDSLRQKNPPKLLENPKSPPKP
jgi:hypothetical protein